MDQLLNALIVWFWGRILHALLNLLLTADEDVATHLHSGPSSASFINILSAGGSTGDVQQKTDFSPPHSPSVAQTLPYVTLLEPGEDVSRIRPWVDCMRLLVDGLIDWLISHLSFHPIPLSIDWLIAWLFGWLIAWLIIWLIDWLIVFFGCSSGCFLWRVRRPVSRPLTPWSCSWTIGCSMGPARRRKKIKSENGKNRTSAGRKISPAPRLRRRRLFGPSTLSDQAMRETSSVSLTPRRRKRFRVKSHDFSFQASTKLFFMLFFLHTFRSN